MMFNATKCKVLHIGGSNKHFVYSMLDCQLLKTDEERDLGIVISKDLKSASQWQVSYARASRMLGMIRRNIEYKNKSILVKLYKLLVRPLLEYCTQAWSPYYCKDKLLLERVQHRFTRMIPGFKSMTYEDRLK